MTQYDIALANPPEPASTGDCGKCGEDFGDHAFEVTTGPGQISDIYCAGCTRDWIKDQMDGVRDEHLLGALQSVDEIAKCKGCDRFVCECR